MKYQENFPDIVELPYLFTPSQSDITENTEANDLNSSYVFPQTSNTLSVNENLLIPDPQVRSFREYLKTEYLKREINPYFVDTSHINSLRGNIHCKTNTVRFCKQMIKD